MEAIISFLQEAPWWQAVLLLLAENLALLVLALAAGQLLVVAFARRRVAPPAPPLEREEVAATVSCVVLNTMVTLAGLGLWRMGIIRFRTDVGVWAWLDALALLMIMDLAMYVLHRLGHHPWLFPLLHRMHHTYDRPRPLTLFVLNPAENLSYGVLWLAVVSVYPASWLGMSVYLVLNLAFGTVGHLGVEPLPDAWARLPVLRYLGTSSFHAQHHQDLGHNFGFYTLIWDRLFGTIRPDYGEVFGRLLPPAEGGSEV
jgi:sterol desaturase/sphingolipid hydroxylase (fatty acid hydroxylase superfamily)